MNLAQALSQVLVAFTIEFDNEWEHRISKTYARPFKVSIAMWSNYLRYVRTDGTPFGEVVRLSCCTKETMASTVGGMERWGYIEVGRDPKAFGTGRALKTDTVIKPKMTGTLALEKWDGLAAEIESRWRSRLGDDAIYGLRDALAPIEGREDGAMPYFLPVIGGPMFTAPSLAEGEGARDDDLPALLSRILLRFTLDYESEMDVSLPIAADVVRVLGAEPVRMKDVPLLSGLSKEAVSVSMTWLTKNGYIGVEQDPTARGKVVRLTPKGLHAQESHAARVQHVECRWTDRFGANTIETLRLRLEAILEQPGGEDGPLSAGLVPPPGCWRGEGRYKAQTKAFIENPREGLPRQPMVLHRGGWPDGS
jgi:DNA-binding MarR family transcriptional regulator